MKKAFNFNKNCLNIYCRISSSQPMNLKNEKSSGLEMSLEEQFIIKCLRSEYNAEGYDEFANFNFDNIDWNITYEKSIQWKYRA